MLAGTRHLARLRLALAATALIAVVAGCSGATFDPSGPCTADGRAAGAYPALEALVPRELDGRPPMRVDSGRNCTAAALGSLARHGVAELRFAGSTWEDGPNAGVTLAILEAPDLRADWVHEFYRLGAEAGRNTENVTSSDMAIDGIDAERLDTLNGESFQTVVAWQDGDRVRVVLVASFIREASRTEHDAAVEDAVATVLGSRER